MKLYTYDDAINFDIKTVHNLYSRYISKSQTELISSFGFGQELVESAEGSYIYTQSGKKILDMTGGIGVLNHGHNNAEILNIRKRFQKEKRMEVHKNYFSPYLAALSHNVAEILPGDLNISYFPNSGAEAVEGAVKMAFKYHDSKRKTLLHSDISFHGKLLGAASFTGSPESYYDFPKIAKIDAFNYNDIHSLVRVVNQNKEDIYAILIEPLNASSMRQCSREFLQKLRSICDEQNIVLIFDEVYTGWGKTGSMFHFEKYDLIPDIVTYAKSFGGGKASISGYTAREKIFRKAYDNLRDATLHSTTYYGFGEETVTALEAINICVREDFPKKSYEMGLLLENELNLLKDKHPNIIKEIRGSGALWGIILESKFIESIIDSVKKLVPLSIFKETNFSKKLVTAMIISSLYNEFGILTYYGSNKDIPLKISPNLTATENDLKYFIHSLDQVLSNNLISNISNFIKTKYFKILSKQEASID